MYLIHKSLFKTFANTKKKIVTNDNCVFKTIDQNMNTISATKSKNVYLINLLLWLNIIQLINF